MTFEAYFPPGTTTFQIHINITDDDVYEGDESFRLRITDNVEPRYVSRFVRTGNPNAVTVIIRDDEESKQFLFLTNLYCYLHLICIM